VGLIFAATFFVIGLDWTERKAVYAQAHRLLRRRWRAAIVEPAAAQR